MSDKDKKFNTYLVQENNEEDYSDVLTEPSPSPEPITKTVTKTKPSPKSKQKSILSGTKKKFIIKENSYIDSLKSLIDSLDIPRTNKNQKELVILLKELDSMVGLCSLKEQLMDQILFIMQELQDSGSFFNAVLTGNPGTGKTTVCGILAKIYCKIGLISSEKVVVADRSALVGKYLGSTSIKTKQVLESALGGVLFIDEVYSLGSKDSNDSFSKECIDTITQYLSDNVGNIICIIAGYKDLINTCFFGQNPGLERRFPWKFNIDNYSPKELVEIMVIHLGHNEWKTDVKNEYLLELINSNKDHFNGNGGDIRNLIDKCKIAHSRRVFSNFKKKDIDKLLNKEDINNGFKYYLTSKEISDKNISLGMMYI
jgi:hypothetical protein